MPNVIASETNGIAPEVTLLPCPWCGKGDKLTMHARKTRHYDKPLEAVMCTRCGTRGRYQLTEKRATAAWNTRPLDAESEMAQRIQSLELECAKLQEELREAGNRGECEMVTSGTPSEGNTDKRCTACGAYNIGEYYDGLSHIASPKFCPNCGRKVKR